jgi:hypothetical protein
MADPLNPKKSRHTASTLTPGVQWAQSNSPSLKKTRLGLSLVFFGTLITIIFIAVILTCSQLMGSKYFNESGAKVVATILGLLLAIFIKIIGPGLCLAVPAESGSKRFLLGSIVLDLIAIVNTTVQIISPMAIPSIYFYFIELCNIISVFIFIYFLKKLSEYIGRGDLSIRSKYIMKGYVLCAAIVLGIYIVLFLTGSFLFFLVVAFMGVFFFFIYLFLTYISLINDLRKALGGVKVPATS